MSSQPNYRVIFNGRLVQGYSVDQVAKNLARIFKQDLKNVKQAAKIDRILSGQPFVIKSQLTEEEARRYCDAMRKLGAECQVGPDIEGGNLKPHFIERRKLIRRKLANRRKQVRGSSILPDRRSGSGRRQVDSDPNV